MMIYNVEGYPTMLFHDIYPTFEDFQNGRTVDINNEEKLLIGYNDLPEFNAIETLTPDGQPYNATLKTIYYLLIGRYGNSPIANMDINQFSVKLFSIIYQYGPTWQVKKQIQYNLRKLKDADIREGSKAIYNHAYNPGEDPTTNSLEELDYINDQNTTNYKKSRIEGYFAQMDLLKDSLDKTFLNKFQHLFLQIGTPTRQIYYGTEEEN